MRHTPFGMYMDHVGDLEEWNEDAGFVWGTPTIAVGENLVTVVHPHTYPNVGPGLQGGVIHSVVIAVYTHEGKRVALWVLDKNGTGNHADHNYWGGGGSRERLHQRDANA